MSGIAIVGAGSAGLAAAYELRTEPINVTVFEKSRGYGGRAATRGRYGHRYDHGAPYFSAPTHRVRRLVTAHLPTAGLVEIGREIGGFTSAGDRVQAALVDASPRWTYRQGISTLGKLLARQSRATFRTETRIAAVQREGGSWALKTDEGRTEQGFDAVLLTPPAPQTASMLETERASRTVNELQDAVAAVEYDAQFAVVLAYDRRIGRPENVLGLRSTDGEHPLNWIGFETVKPGHVREGHSLLVVHTAPHWTAERVDEDPDAYVPDVKGWAEEILDESLQHPVWYDTQRWRYAVPVGQIDPAPVAAARTEGLFLAGDAVAGTGRVGAALQNGLEAADQLREYRSW